MPMSFASEFLCACPRIDLKIDDVTVAVWSVSLKKHSTSLGSFLEALNTDELNRAKRISDRRNRSRYVVAHGALRIILSDYTRVDPRLLRFVMGRHGKPSLARGRNGMDVRYNLSHTDDMAAVAVAVGH